AARTEEPPVERQVDAALTEALSALAPVFELTGSSPVGQHWFAGDAGLLPRWLEGVPLRQSDHPRGYRLRQWGRTAQALEPLQATVPQARWQLLSGQVGRQQAAAALDRGLAAASVAERFAAGGFGTFDPATQDRTVARSVDASDQLRESLRTALAAEILSRRQFAPGGFFGKVAALEREANRSRGGLSVRKLMTEFGDVVTAVTPCVLVSPDSLARFIPPGSVQFDLVVFDEASQIRVADSIGALGRAAAVIIAGDSKQMPPQSFGEGYRDDTIAEVSGTTDDEAAAGEEFWVVPDEESILSECVQSGVTRRWLSWHYRSRDESLIAFSNAQYYENRLSTFPAVPGQVHDTGVSFVRVQGQFIRSERAGTDRGEDDQVDGSDPAEATTAERRRMLRTNPAEAATVVQEVLRRWQNRERSIGVVTFNVQQRSLIEQLLWDSGVEGVPESLVARADGEGLFVKNLENVQGDERDVILFSTGFSANANGILPLNFGPLNRSGGERRLNVAITRARRRVIVFSSFEPEDLRVEQTSSVGLRHLRAYLEMAKYGVSALEPSRTDVGAALVAPALTSIVRPVTVDRHRDEIAAALQARGVAVQTSLGLSEFRVDLALAGAAAPDRPVLAVLLDSPEWAGRRTTGDRDGLPLTVLSQLMGWPRVSRVWLPDWLTDPDRVLDRLGQQLTDALTAPRSVGETQARTHWDVFDPEQLDTVSDLEPDAEPDEEPVDDPERPGADRLDDGPELTFVAFQPHLRASRSVLDKATQTRPARRQVQQLISEIVELEGPVSIERLARLVAACHGISRVVDSRLADIRSVVPETIRRDPEEGFCWPDTRDPLRWHGYRRTPAGGLKERPLDDVALREIANAAAYIVRNAMGITTEELTKELVRVFGGSRVTATLKTRIATAVELGVRLRILRTSGELVVPGDGRTQLQ
ncbi:MAG: DUF3320 domain-containing protein, partial [Propionibacteriaceae bacterium]